MKPPLRLRLVVCAVLLTGACGRPDHEQQGTDYLAAKQYQEAVIAYRNAINEEPNRGDLRLKLAEAYTGAKEPVAALGEYVRAADLLPDSIEANLKSAQLLLASRQLEDAKTRAERVLAVDPRNVDALLVKGTVLAGQNDLSGAMTEFQAVLAIDPANSSGYRNVGVLQLTDGRRNEAAATFRQAVAAAPGSFAARQALANFLWSTGDRQAAEVELKAALAIEPKNASANSLLGIFYLTSERAAEAEPYFKFVATSSDTAAAWLALSDFYQMAGRRDEARKLIERMMGRKDGLAPATVRLAALEAAEGHPDRAQEQLRALLNEHPTDALALALNARLSLAAGKRDDALADARKAVANAASPPIMVAAHTLAAEILRSLDRVPEAIREYEEILKIDRRPVKAALALAALHLAAGHPDRATTFAEQALTLAPDDPEVQGIVVRTGIRAGRLSEAKGQLAELQNTYPNSARVANLTALTQLLDHQVDAARVSYSRALELVPGDFEALTGLTDIDMRTGRTADARKRIDEHLRGPKPTVDLLVLGARIYANTGDARRAEQLLTQAVALDSQRLQTYSLLSQLYFREKRVDAAIVQMQKLIERDPNSVPAITLLGMMHELQRRLPEAEQQYRRALSIDSRAAVAANNLAWLLVSGNRELDTALQLAQDAKQAAPEEPIIDDTLGWIYYQKKMTGQAISSLEMSVEKAPTEAQFHYHLGMARMQAGHISTGRQSLQRALSLRQDFEGVAEARQALSRLQR